MPIAYIHLSDIHFGQERGGELIIHDDAKDRLLEDVQAQVANLSSGRASGIIVTGDIAYAGKQEEYKKAADWLDRMAKAAGCEITDILVVPGNHDIDREEISAAAAWMLKEVAEKGESQLDTFLENERDRAVFYGRFNAYIPFAEGYNCSLDRQGGLASEKIVELAPGRNLQFVGFNSALVCKAKDLPGELLLGARQRVLPIKPGHELVVLCHHPLHWLQDSEDARRFIQNRARVFISGHEHKPGVNVDPIENGCDLLRLEAGATVPPTATGPYTYTYNILEFGFVDDKLEVTVHPRAWDDKRKRFGEDLERLGGKDPSFLLGCPNFRAGTCIASKEETPLLTPVMDMNPPSVEAPQQVATVPQAYSFLLLRFFRDLSEGQRIAVLAKLGALPEDWADSSSHSLERTMLDELVTSGRLDDVAAAIEDELTLAKEETKDV